MHRKTRRQGLQGEDAGARVDQVSFKISTLEHALASAAQAIVHQAKTITSLVIPALQKAQSAQPIIDAVLSTVNPNAALIERASFAILGKVLSALSDGQAAVQAGGVNIALDAQELADLKALASSLKPIPATS